MALQVRDSVDYGKQKPERRRHRRFKAALAAGVLSISAGQPDLAPDVRTQATQLLRGARPTLDARPSRGRVPVDTKPTRLVKGVPEVQKTAAGLLPRREDTSVVPFGLGTGSTFTLAYHHGRPPYQSEVPLSLPFEPSHRLVKHIAQCSKRVLHEYRKLLSSIPSRLFEGREESEAENIARIRGTIADLMQGTLETLAFRGSALGVRVVQVSNQAGEFTAPVSDLLEEAIPVRPYERADCLRKLCAELASYSEHRPVLGRWGRLYLAPCGICLHVTAAAPPPPPPEPRVRVAYDVQV